METVANSLEVFNDAAGVFIQSIHPKAAGATLITLSGELGAGKTAFVKAAAKTLGVREEVTSPTFVLLKAYELPSKPGGGGFARLIHVDLYRLEKSGDLAPLHFDEYLAQADNLIMLEWPEKGGDALSTPDVRIAIETLPSRERKISYA
jgi:tRNA threonylcarbamoyl adenosine modification protein YjeE